MRVLKWSIDKSTTVVAEQSIVFRNEAVQHVDKNRGDRFRLQLCEHKGPVHNNSGKELGDNVDDEHCGDHHVFWHYQLCGRGFEREEEEAANREESSQEDRVGHSNFLQLVASDRVHRTAVVQETVQENGVGARLVVFVFALQRGS
jgi:hypothetical protein